MKLFVFIAFVLLGTTLAVELSEEHQFKSWMKTYNKVYSTDAEYLAKLTIFKENLKRYAKLNEKDDTVTHGPTKFSDMTHEEFVAKYLIKNYTSPLMRGEKVNVAPKLNAIPLPSNYSWVAKGATTPVYNQGQCGSCWAFSTTESIESMNFLAGNSLIQLSMQQIVDCDTTDSGCDGGDPPTAYQYVISAGGLESLADYPYTAQDGTCQFNSGEIARSISSWQYVTTDQDEQQMQQFTYTTGPPSVLVDASTWDSYQGGVYTSSNCGTQLDHAVQIVGWANFQGQNAWIVRNSWGTGWGYSGYLYVAIGQNACGIAQECTSAIV